jgi:hypothetical protein
MFRVFFTNHGYYADTTFDHLDRAFAYGRKCGFQFSVWQGAKLMGSWCPIGGTRLIQYDDVEFD